MNGVDPRSAEFFPSARDAGPGREPSRTFLFHLLRRLFPHRRPVLAGVFLFMALAAAGLCFVSPSEDLNLFIPREPEQLRAEYAALSSAPFMRRLFFSVSGDDPPALARQLETSLAGPDFLWTGGGMGALIDPAGSFAAALPLLLDPDKLAGLDLNEDAVMKAVEDSRRRLLSPSGIGLRTAVACDPFNLCRLVFEGRSVPFSMRFEQGVPVSADGKHALAMAAPDASMNDSAAATRIMERAEAAIRTLPEGTKVSVTGGYRHSAVNAAIIKDDLNRVMPVSLIGLGVLLVLWARRGAAQVALAPLFALVCAVWGSYLPHGGVSGIILGFGSVLLGISIDYAFHMQAAIKDAPGEAAGAANRIGRPLFAGSTTTLATFSALLLSTTPIISRTAQFSLIGLLAALVYALIVLPLSLAKEAGSGKTAEPEHRARSVMRPGAGVWAALALPLILFFAAAGSLRFDGDLRSLSAVSPALAKDEAAFIRTWAENGESGEKAFFSVQGRDEEEVLQKAEAMDTILGDARLGPKPGYVLSPSLFLPSQEMRRERAKKWRAFWAARGPAVAPALEKAASASGFSAEAFAPFLRLMREGADPALEPPGAEVARRQLLSETSRGWRAYVFVPASYAPSKAVRDRAGELGAVYVRGADFRENLSSALSADMSRVGLIALCLILPMVWLAMRSPRLTAAALFPTGMALAAMAIFLALQPKGVNFFHAAGVPLVLGLSLDYGIFMVFAIGQDHEKSSRRAVFLCAASSCIGFGSLCFARHPALFSLGATVGVGLAAACAAALWALPSRLFTGKVGNT